VADTGALSILPLMAKDQFSFDIVSEVDLQEVRNAVDQAGREIAQRFDFKNTGTTIALSDQTIELHSSTEDRLKAAWQVLQERAIKRSIPLKALHPGEIADAAKGTVRQNVDVVTGISDEKTKEISKFVRQAVPKVQTQIQGAQVRVLGKSKDQLQSAIQAVKEHDFGIALQFTNYRP
jgi:cyclic-di-GMP-binding protein